MNQEGIMTRDERQSLSIERWKNFNGRATIQAATGYGKSFVALKIIKKLVSKRPDFSIIIVVPTTTLKEQWESHINNIGCNQNCRVFVINSAIKEKYNCDLLVLDEEHRYASETFKTIFECVQYKLILGLTATFERLDGKHELIKEYCPICDTITLIEAEANGWVSPYTEYLVLIEVDDIKEYQEINTKFNEAFEFFNNDFPLCMSLKGPNGWKAQLALRDTMCPRGTDEERLQVLRNIKIMSAQFGRTLQARKKFINYHPKKLEITRQIIDNRPDSKIITFSNTIEMADSIKRGLVYSGRDSKKKGRATLEQIRNGEVRVLNTVAKANEG